MATEGFQNLVQVSLCTIHPPWAICNFSQLPQSADAFCSYSLHLECLATLFHLANSSLCFTTTPVFCLKERSLSKMYLSKHTTDSFTCVPHLPGCETSKPESDWLSFMFLSPWWQCDLLHWCSPPQRTIPTVILSFEYGLNLLPTLTSRTWKNTSCQLKV